MSEKNGNHLVISQIKEEDAGVSHQLITQSLQNNHVGPPRPTTSTTQFALKTPKKFENFEKLSLELQFTKIDSARAIIVCFCGPPRPNMHKTGLKSSGGLVGGLAFD